MTAATSRKATRREWTGLAVIALPCIVYAMDLTVLNLAIPVISADLDPSATQLLWIIDIYGFLVGGFLITMGTLGDRIGRRRLLFIGAAAFGIASTIAAFSRSAQMLIAMRALLGVAGATLAPSTMSLIRNMFDDPRERQFAVGAWIASFSLGSAIGPLVGGVMLEFFAWGSVFLIAVPVMLLLLAVGPALLPEYRDPQAGRIDFASVVLSLAGVLSTIYGLKQMAATGISWTSIAAVTTGVALGVLFVRRQRALAYPLLDLKLFAMPRFTAAIAAYALACLAMFGVYIFITQYLQLVLGLSPLAAGLATLPCSLAFVIGSLAAPRLTHRVPSVAMIGWGLGAAATGFVLLALVGYAGGLALLVVSTVIMSLGLAPVFTVGNDMIIASAPPERAGAASALSETSAEFSGAVGVAVVGSLGTAIYRQGLVERVPAAPAASLDTIAGAVSAAEALGGTMGQALLHASRAAFVDAMQASAMVGALVVVLAGVLATRMLRAHGASPEVR